MKCEAYQYSDSMICQRCGQLWDVNDPAPPPCQQKDSDGSLPLYVGFLMGLVTGMALMLLVWKIFS